MAAAADAAAEAAAEAAGGVASLANLSMSAARLLRLLRPAVGVKAAPNANAGESCATRTPVGVG